jgi:hypothetical protein
VRPITRRPRRSRTPHRALAIVRAKGIHPLRYVKAAVLTSLYLVGFAKKRFSRSYTLLYGLMREDVVYLGAPRSLVSCALDDNLQTRLHRQLIQISGEITRDNQC